ncbi:sulfurtransferase TusA family protein [Aestuariibius sp. HNIBRBA575]|uniref:sulfurtransferase TusA family protein n=1 Tax=Aestuariibius sp. HNIBRBA575 TaxID=3233343 RepID=UPI0034A58002
MDQECDAIGLLCPLPVLKARKRLMAMDSGAVLTVLADDPAAIIDIPHFCTEAGHTFLGVVETGAYQTYSIRKA